MKDYIRVIQSLPNNCRKTKDGKYEAYVSNKKYIYLGRYADEKEAKDKIINYRVNVFVESVKEYNLNPDDCKMFEDIYLVFPTGEIFNCYGRKIMGDINRDGYIIGTLNKKFYQFHRVIAMCFLPGVEGKNFVNHKDGNKQNNNVNNLEWCTKSENAIHSFKNYLQDNIAGHPIISNEDISFVKENYWKTQITTNVLSQYFNLSRGQIQQILYNKHKNKLEVENKVLFIWNMKSNYTKLGYEIGKCSRSIRRIKNKIGKDYDYEIFKHISDELQREF